MKHTAPSSVSLDDDWRRVKVHRIEPVVIDHDEMGADDVCAVLENARYPNRCIRPVVLSVDTREVNWSDSHPLNQESTFEATYRKIFDEPGDPA